MDFLFLLLSYLALLLLLLAAICFCPRTTYPTRVAQIMSRIVPECLQRAALGPLHYLFHSRNRAFVVLHLLLQGATYAEYGWELQGYCRELGFPPALLLLPYLLLLLSLLFFTLTCVTDPGTITRASEPQFLGVYKPDGVMFLHGVRCPTCHVQKPARSKHCRICDRCVHRFDHHCVWVNNCVGARNAGYFLAYLSALTASAAALAAIGAAFLVRLVVASGLYRDAVVDDRGDLRVVDAVFLTQFLFLTLPRIIFMLGFVALLSLLLGGYLCFMLYLAATNRTTNEWHRSRQIRRGDCARGAGATAAEPRACRNIYSRGFWANLGEIFLPAAAGTGAGEEDKRR